MKVAIRAILRVVRSIDPVGPFRLAPRVTSGSYSASHLDKGETYHRAFNELPGRRLAWEWERRLLGEILRTLDSREVHLDFAGGTGRIAHYFRNQVARQYILDVSASMLEVARDACPDAVIICKDFRAGVSGIPENGVDIATAFRFFPNAEPHLREQAMNFIAGKVRPGGWLLCNNHRNFCSIPYLSQRLLFYRGGSGGMKGSDLESLAMRHGFAFVRRVSFGVLPQTERVSFLPWAVIRHAERAIYNLTGGDHSLGYNTLFLFRRE